MEILPFNDDILLHIFQNVSLKILLNIRLVCRRWFWIVDKICRKKKTFIVSEDMFAGNYQRHTHEDKIDGFVNYYLVTYGAFIEHFFFLKLNKNLRVERNVKDFVARYELDERLLEGIIKYCTKLRHLDFTKQIFDTYSTFSLLQKLPHSLQALRIELCRLDETGNVDETISSIFKTCSNLEEFSLYGSCYGYLELSDKAFNELSKNFRRLDISCGFSVSISNLNWLKNVENLTELHLERTEFDNDDLNILVFNCFRLEQLTLAYAKRVTNFGALSHLKRLIYLKLDGNRDYFDDTALQQICNNCCKLSFLSLENCRQLTNASLIFISNLRYLCHLDICSIPAVDDKALEWICNYCRELQTLQIKFCKRLTENGLIFTANLPRLITLGCPFTGQELSRQQLTQKIFK